MKVLLKAILLYLSLTTTFLFSQNEATPADTVFNGHIVSSDWIDQGISAGVDFSNYLYGEIGYYRSYVWEAGGLPALSTTMNYGAEYSYIDRFIIAPKIQGRLQVYFFNTSLSAIYYTDLKQEDAIILRPEIGIGFFNFDVNYGYNIGIYKNGFNQYNRHVVAIRAYIKLHHKFIGEYDTNGNKSL